MFLPSYTNKRATLKSFPNICIKKTNLELYLIPKTFKHTQPTFPDDQFAIPIIRIRNPSRKSRDCIEFIYGDYKLRDAPWREHNEASRDMLHNPSTLRTKFDFGFFFSF